MSRFSVVIPLLLAFGLGLAGVADSYRRESVLQEVTQASLRDFRIVYYDNSKPILGTLAEVPDGATFFTPPKECRGVSAVLSEEHKPEEVLLDVFDTSRSKQEQTVLLEVITDGTIRRYKYLAGETSITPVARRTLDGALLGKTLQTGFLWALPALLLIPFLLLGGSKRVSGKRS